MASPKVALSLGQRPPEASVVKGGSTEAPRILAIEDDSTVEKILK